MNQCLHSPGPSVQPIIDPLTSDPALAVKSLLEAFPDFRADLSALDDADKVNALLCSPFQASAFAGFDLQTLAARAQIQPLAFRLVRAVQLTRHQSNKPS